jgi:holo-[acyl-carrier protein] synthase
VSVSVLGVGIDIVPIARVEGLLARHGDRALRRLFTHGERGFAATQAHPAVTLAARVAAKEAAYKALSGTEDARGIGWTEIEVERLADGRPVLRLHGRAASRLQALGGTRCHLSLTHDGGVAAAVVVIE